MNLHRSLLSLSLLLSFYTVHPDAYWPEIHRPLDPYFHDTLRHNVELALQRLAQHNLQNTHQREMKATYRVGQTVSIITPYDNRGDFCRWQFLFNGLSSSYEEGIRKLEQSGLLRFAGYHVDNRMCVEVWSTDFPCDEVDQMTINFVATRPGKIIFYMKNKEYSNYGSHGCSCKPTITKFEITIVEDAAPTFYLR